MVCVLSQVEELLTSVTDCSKWLEELSPLIIKLKRCVEVTCSRAKAGLTFLTIEVRLVCTVDSIERGQ